MQAFIIYNPAAGQRDKTDEVFQLAGLLEERGWSVVDLVPTERPGDATGHARRAATQGCDAVFVAGGDGTVAQAVDGLAGTETALGVLPGGTGNVLARQLNLPVPGGLRPHALLDSLPLLLDGTVRRVDVGRASTTGGHTRHFLCWSGIGFDAEVNQAVAAEPERKQRLGMAAFLVATLLALRDFAGTRAIVRIDGRRSRHRLLMLVANNIQLYGGWFKMAPRALLDDGLLDVYLFLGRQPQQTLWHAVRLLFGLHEQAPAVVLYRARRIEVISARPLRVHVDGDSLGYTPAVIEVVPGVLKLMVPATAPSNLFRDVANTGEPPPAADWVARLARDAQAALLGRSSET